MPFKKGNPGRPKGIINKMTMDQRAIFDEAISRDDRVLLVQNVLARALGNNDKDAAPYMKLIFDFVFARPKIGHQVSIVNPEELFTPEVRRSVWNSIIAEAREKDAKGQGPPRLEVIDAQVVETTGDGGKKTNGPLRNGRKKATRKKTRKAG